MSEKGVLSVVVKKFHIFKSECGGAVGWSVDGVSQQQLLEIGKGLVLSYRNMRFDHLPEKIMEQFHQNDHFLLWELLLFTKMEVLTCKLLDRFHDFLVLGVVLWVQFERKFAVNSRSFEPLIEDWIAFRRFTFIKDLADFCWHLPVDEKPTLSVQH